MLLPLTCRPSSTEATLTEARTPCSLAVGVVIRRSPRTDKKSALRWSMPFDAVLLDAALLVPLAWDM